MPMFIFYMNIMSNNVSFMVFVGFIEFAMSNSYIIAFFGFSGLDNCLALLVRMILGNLMAVLIMLVMAFWSMGVAMESMRVSMVISISFVVVAMMLMRNNMRVMSDNMTFMVDFSVIFMTMCGDHKLTLLNVGDIYNDLALIMACVMRDLVALFFFLVFALMRTNGVIVRYISNRMMMMVVWIGLTLGRSESAIHKTGGQEKN